MDNEQIRSFIAVELPEDVKSGLRDLQARLTLPKYSCAKCVAPEGIHLTLKFLGNISPQQVTQVTEVMKQASQGVSPFQLELSEVGAFPNSRRPRVVWVGIKGEVDKLIAWQLRLDNGLAPLGFPRETRPFTPHLTLARLREGCPPADRQNVGEAVARTPADVNYKINVKTLNLMRSKLLPTGAVYTCLAEVTLQG